MVVPPAPSRGVGGPVVVPVGRAEVREDDEYTQPYSLFIEVIITELVQRLITVPTDYPGSVGSTNIEQFNNLPPLIIQHTYSTSSASGCSCWGLHGTEIILQSIFVIILVCILQLSFTD